MRSFTVRGRTFSISRFVAVLSLIVIMRKTAFGPADAHAFGAGLRTRF